MKEILFKKKKKNREIAASKSVVLYKTNMIPSKYKQFMSYFIH